MIGDLHDMKDLSERARERLRSRIEKFTQAMIDLQFWQTDLQREVEAENQRLTQRVHELAVALQKAETKLSELDTKVVE